MNFWKVSLLAAVFLGLVALEIAHGLFRLETLEERHGQELDERLARDKERLIREIRGRLDEGRRHALYLSRTRQVQGIIAQGATNNTLFALQQLVLPHLATFESIDRVRVLDDKGMTVFRAERMGQGVGMLTPSQISREPDLDILALAKNLTEGHLIASKIRNDVDRVEVVPRNRRVLHQVAALSGGYLVLTLYADPLLEAVRRFAPFAGIHARLGYGMSNDSPEAGQDLLKVSVMENPPMVLEIIVPKGARQAALAELGSDVSWIIGGTLLVTAALAGLAIFVMRMSLRSLKLAETERELIMQKRLQNSERLSALGLLTAGVAHEINNPLEGIGNYLTLLERNKVDADQRRRYLERIGHGFGRIRDIVRDLLRFSRPEAGMAQVDLGVAARRACELVGLAKDCRGCSITLTGFEAPLIFEGDVGRIEQVIINLVLNAARALDGQGEISLSGSRTSDSFIQLIVEDGGQGILPEDLDRIFDPFYSRSGGTGLGLAVSYGTVVAHGGTLVAENRLSGGARFIMSLPATMKTG